MASRFLSLLTSLVFFGLPLPVHAQPAAPARDFVGKLRLNPGLASHSINVGGSESVTLAGGSLSLELYEIAFVEAGGNLMFVGINSPAMPDLYAWFGISPVVADGREPDGDGWILQLDGVVGYRNYVTENEAHEAFFVRDENHNLAVGLGLEQTGWLAPHFGLTFRALAVASIPLHVERTHPRSDLATPEELELLVSVMPSFGVVF